jgi:hypothetical protein
VEQNFVYYYSNTIWKTNSSTQCSRFYLLSSNKVLTSKTLFNKLFYVAQFFSKFNITIFNQIPQAHATKSLKVSATESFKELKINYAQNSKLFLNFK